ncbi:MAG: CehA/McbA family metallohydrolase [Planctomycetales bacterium]|nr:CehA/McbA family metallohydrolase [Planctomycetales bacterium]
MLESFFLRIAIAVVALTIAVGWLPCPAFAARYDGKLTIVALDAETRERIAVRMELRDGRGRPVRVKSDDVISHGNYFVFDGEVTLELRKGSYEFLIEAGPEYQTRPGHFTIERHAEDETEVVLQRRVNMQAEGWWAGDLDVQQGFHDLPLLMRAIGVDLVPVFNQENTLGKCREAKVPKSVDVASQSWLDNRRGGGLLYLNADQPVEVCQAKADESTMPMLARATEAGAEVIALTPFAWELPIWIAAGKLDAIQVIHRHALGDSVVDNEGWGRPRDKAFFPGKTGNGRWSEAIYHHVLNCGLRIPPAAGSGSGMNDNPVGTNRVYVHCDDQFSQQSWFDGLLAGQVVVTNGPLLRTHVEGQPPGHVFHVDRGDKREFQIGLSLTFYEMAPVEYLEIIRNGQVEHTIRLDELAKQQGRLPPVEFDASGWFAVRARTSKSQVYQFATTGPYYVEANYQRRISRQSVQFFLDWLDEARHEFAENEEVLADIAAAQPFWEELLSKANAE